MESTLRILKARHGDAFIFECKHDEKVFVMMIDSGPRLCMKEIVPIIKGLRQIDILVLTHYDEDHISGFIEYFKKYPEDTHKIREYWCNCACQIEECQEKTISAYHYAKNFADSLRTIQRKHQNVKWIELIKAGHRYHNDLVDIEVVAPSEQALSDNREIYIKEQYPAISYQNMEGDFDISLI